MPLNIDIQQVLLHMLNFVLLFGALYFLLYSPVKSFMEKRQAVYEDRAKELEEQSSKLEELKSEYQARLDAAGLETDAIKAKAQDEIAKMKADAEKEAELKASEIIESGKKTAMLKHDEIIAQTNQQAADIVAKAADRLVFASDSDAFDSFLETVKDSEADA